MLNIVIVSHTFCIGMGGLKILHHCLKVGKLDDSCLVILSEVCQVGIATDDVIGSYSVGKCKEIEVFRVSDGHRTDIGLNEGKLAEGINDVQQVIEVVRAKIFAYLITVSHIADFLDELCADVNIKAQVCQHPAHEASLMTDEE